MADDTPEPLHVNMPVKPEPITATDIPPDGGIDNSLQPTDKVDDPAPPASSDTPAADTPPVVDDASKPKVVKKSPFQARIDTLTAKNAEAERRASEAQAQAELYKAMAEGKAEGKLAPTAAEIDRMVQDRATQLEVQRQSQKIITSGNAEYPDFTDRCNIVASLGAGDRADFMQVISDPDIIPDGHKLIALLAEKPEEASQILDARMSTAQMSARLVKFQIENSKPAAGAVVSKLAPPIRPIDGQTRGGGEMNDREPMSSYAAKFMAQRAQRFAKK